MFITYTHFLGYNTDSNSEFDHNFHIGLGIFVCLFPSAFTEYRCFNCCNSLLFFFLPSPFTAEYL